MTCDMRSSESVSSPFVALTTIAPGATQRRRVAQHVAHAVRRHRGDDDRRVRRAPRRAPPSAATRSAAERRAGSAAFSRVARNLVDQRRRRAPTVRRRARLARAVDGERGAPAAGAENGDRARSSAAHSDPALRAARDARAMLARWRNRISARDADARRSARLSARRRPARPTAASRVAATDPSEMTRVSQTVSRTPPAPRRVAIGASTANTPAATATPLPPWNRSHTG